MIQVSGSSILTTRNISNRVASLLLPAAVNNALASSTMKHSDVNNNTKNNALDSLQIIASSSKGTDNKNLNSLTRKINGNDILLFYMCASV